MPNITGGASLVSVVSGESMQREVFILPTGQSFLAWEPRFGVPQQHVETAPASDQKPDGSTIRNGTAYVTIETADVKFCACSGSLAVGQKGQLSSTGDEFFEVMISAIESAGDHDLVAGHASRQVGIRFEWDR